MDKNGDILKNVLILEAKALELAASKISEENGDLAVQIFKDLISSGANIVFCGVGKSGVIAQKLASTFTSLGLPSFFLHPTEALHGDLGRVGKNDAIVFLSKSGTTEEIVKLMPYLANDKKRMIALVGNTNSPIANKCALVLDCSVEREACINNQAPTTSSTLALAMGDALAVLFEHHIGLTKEGFAENHPGGLLGKSLRMKVSDLMWTPKDCPILSSEETLKDVIIKMTQNPVGGCAIVDNGIFIGIVVEGDIRRTLAKNKEGLETRVADIVNKKPVVIASDALAFDALKLMEQRQHEINLLPVVDNGKFSGLIRLHDLLKEGFTLSHKK